MKAEKFEQAGKIFEKLDDYKDSKKKKNICDMGIQYNEAIALMKEEKYGEARALFEELTDSAYEYKDSRKQEEFCGNKLAYADAQALLDASEYYEAYNAFQEIPDFEDSAEKAQSCIQPMPSTGELYRNEAYAGMDCPIEISRTSATEKLPIILRIRTTDDTAVADIFMAAGEGYNISLPAGSYKITLIMGVDQWFGIEDMFGDLSFEREMNSGKDNGAYVLQTNYTYTLSL